MQPVFTYRVHVRNTPEQQRGAWATYVKALRVATGMGTKSFAEKVGVDPVTLWRWETAKTKPESPAVPEKLAELFKLDLDEVLTAAGLKSAAEVPTEPTREDIDEELEMILRARIPEKVKAELLDMLESDRTADRERRLGHYGRIIQHYRGRMAS